MPKNGHQHSQPVSEEQGGESPRWDDLLRTLFVGEHVIKQFRQPAPTQIRILTAFEEEQWVLKIDDPLPPVKGKTNGAIKQRLRSAVQDLNRGQNGQFKVRFSLDGTGQGVFWRTESE